MNWYGKYEMESSRLDGFSCAMFKYRQKQKDASNELQMRLELPDHTFLAALISIMRKSQQAEQRSLVAGKLRRTLVLPQFMCGFPRATLFSSGEKSA
jgi:hypothetical protein